MYILSRSLVTLQAHNLCRTYTELKRRTRLPIEQINILLGHANITSQGLSTGKLPRFTSQAGCTP